MRKRRKFADGGVTGGQVQQPTYPFYGNQPQAGGQSGGMNQTFNMQPQAMSGPNDQMTQRFAKGGQAKVGKVMSEFKAGKLKSSSGQKVTNPKQAIAIGLSEAGLSKKAKGGEMKESKAMVKKEIGFMKKKGAPKSMIKHEMSEMSGMKHGGKVKKMAMGGYADGGMPMVMKDGQKVPAFAADGKGKMAKGGGVKKMASGGMTASKMGSVKTAAPSRDGVAVKGKTKGTMVKMAGNKGMKKGGYC
jgi:hypothetical protein